MSNDCLSQLKILLIIANLLMMHDNILFLPSRANIVPGMICPVLAVTVVITVTGGLGGLNADWSRSAAPVRIKMIPLVFIHRHEEPCSDRTRGVGS